jgi:hypothetical protein
MYETDILVFCLAVTAFIYMKGVFSDIKKYFDLFRSVKGPKTLPFGLIAYIFTSRSESGSSKVSSGIKSITRHNEVFELNFQIAFKYFRTYQSVIRTFIVSGLEPNISSSPTIRKLHRNF